MRIGLYGMPTAGKSFILDKIDFMDVLAGSKLLREYDPDFDKRDEKGREKDRKAIVNLCKKHQEFIMDGHYAFGDEVAFTDEDGDMYDQFLYLYISPEILKKRMAQSEKNKKYLRFNLEKWQNNEIESLRDYCHKNNKDFYILDCPPDYNHVDIGDAILFIKDVANGYSNVEFAHKIADLILAEATSDVINLIDGDKTIICEDSSSFVFDYKTLLFDGNFYTGYQTWKQYREFAEYDIKIPEAINIHRNLKVSEALEGTVFIISSGHKDIWQRIAGQLGMRVFTGSEISAETKFFVAKFLRNHGKKVIAYGDSMSDYYMVKEADNGYLVTKNDGQLSKSLTGRDMGGIHLV